MNISLAAGATVYSETREPPIPIPAALVQGLQLVADRVTGACIEREIPAGGGGQGARGDQRPRRGQPVGGPTGAL